MDTSFSTLITINWTLIVHEFLFSNTNLTNITNKQGVFLLMISFILFEELLRTRS